MNYTPFAIGFFLLLGSGCGSAMQEQRAEPRRGEAVTLTPPPKPAVQPTFRQTLERGNFTVDITTTGTGNRRALALTARRAGQELALIRDSVAGEITNALLTDLNQNELPEILVFVQATSAAAHGQAYGYEVATQDWARFQLPVLPPEAAAGYQGHDQFTVTGADLVRTFPIYHPTDAPTTPSGGQRTVRYALDHTLRLTEVSITDRP